MFNSIKRGDNTMAKTVNNMISNNNEKESIRHAIRLVGIGGLAFGVGLIISSYV